MDRTLASQLQSFQGQKVEVRGSISTIRSLGKLNFLILRDRSGFLQVVIQSKETYQAISHLQTGSILHIQGIVAPSGSEFGVEIIDPTIEVISPVTTPSPIDYSKPEIPSDLDFILDHRPLALRNRKLAAVFKVQGAIAHAYRLFMHDHMGATEYFAPNMIGASSEGGSEFFTVDYFGHTATLAQSSQLYKQMMVGVHERVFALMPFFRAEPSHTPRHLTEGKQFEFEMGFFDSWHEILDVQEGCIKFILSYLHTHHDLDLKTIGTEIVKAPQEVPIPRITFKEAQELYYQRTGIDERSEPDLSPAAEKELCSYARQVYGTDLIFITDWQLSKRPFYAFPHPDIPHLTNTFDLLCAGTEITSGGQRRHTYESMLEGLALKQMDPRHFEDYLSVFKQGMPPHGGFGMGLERLTMTLLRLKNIREASLFPSDPRRIAGHRLKAKMFNGSENIRNEIIRQLKDKQMPYEHLIHEPTPTANDSANMRSTLLSEGIKALILKGKLSKKNYQFNIPAHLKLDMKAVSEIVKEKCEFEDPEVIHERFGLKIGGIPPFGCLLNLETFFDEKIKHSARSAFNCGMATESIIMNSQDLITLVDPTWGQFSKE